MKKTNPFFFLVPLLALSFLLAAQSLAQEKKAMPLSLSSASFSDQQSIPARHTCQGAETSPALAFDAVPAQTQSLALIVDDPDAPDPKAPLRTFVHWVVFNIPPQTKSFAEGLSDFPEGTRFGINDGGKKTYIGPCPPIGRHRYFFKLYALDTVLNLPGTPSKNQLLEAMKGHILEETSIVGTYEK